MPFTPKIVALQSDGTTPDARRYPSGIITNALSSNFTLGARKGCRGGELVLPGHARDAFAFEHDQFIRFYFDASTPIYIGRVDAASRKVEVGAGHHVYNLRSPYADLEKIDIPERVILGADGGVEDTGTIQKIVEYLFETYVEPGTVYTLGTIDTNVFEVLEFIIEEGSNLIQIFEQLELMASVGSDYAVSYIAPDLTFNFQHVSTASPVEYEVGTDVLAADQNLRGRLVGNRLSIRGNIGETADGATRRTRMDYPKATSPPTWAASETAWGKKRPRRVGLPTLRREADMDLFADGWLRWYGNPLLRLDNARKAHDSAPAFPWIKLAIFTDTQQGFLGGPELIGSQTFQYGFGLTSEANVGVIDDEGSSYAPTTDKDKFIENLESTLSEFTDLPIATDLTEPYAEAPGEEPGPGGGGGTGGEAIGVEIVDFMVTAGAKPADANVNAHCKLSLNGATLGGSDSVRFYFQHYDEAAAQVASGSRESEEIESSNGFKTYKTETPFTLADQEGYCYCAVRLVLGASTYWYPANIDTDPFDCHAIRVSAGGEGGESVSITSILGAHYVDGG